MTVDFGGAGQFKIAGTTFMTIDTAGRVLRPYHIAFSVYGGGGHSAGQDIGMGGVNFNTGNCYNTANGFFTAPVAGRYFFRYNQLAPHAIGGEYRTAIYLNGGGYGGSRFIIYKVANAWWALIAEAFVGMNAGDYVTVRYESGPGALYTDPNYSSFSGHLIG